MGWGREKGHGGDGSAFLMARRGRVDEKGGRAVGGGHAVGRGWGRLGGPAPRSSGRHQPRTGTNDHVRQGRPGR
jgi:hypothetical protein